MTPIIAFFSVVQSAFKTSAEAKKKDGTNFVSDYHFREFRFLREMQRCLQLQQERFPGGFRLRIRHFCFQWEGAADEDGRTPSIWDTFLHSRGCKLMYDMGLDAFRFSISWSRLIPSGRGPVNPKGLQFYKNFIHELKRHGIEPHVTLHHNDLPQVLEDEYGGWLTAKSYVCFREFGEAVKFWTTINEPTLLAVGGYDVGAAPPSHCSPPFGFVNCSRGNSSTEPYIALHNMLLAHASAARLYKTKYKDKQNGSIGITCFGFWVIPFTSSEEDKIATQRAKDFLLGWVLHPLFLGDYPDVMKRIVGKDCQVLRKKNQILLKTPPTSWDSYTTQQLKAEFIADCLFHFLGQPWEFYSGQLDVLPWGLEGVLEYIKQTMAILRSTFLKTQPDSSLNDVGRVEYLGAYIAAVLNSVRNGSDTRGYFQWSFMDLFEVIDTNYTYGLYHVNFSDPQRKRTPKTSAFWYSAFLNGTQQEPKNLSVSSSPGFASQ
ncbi:unnamed protein product [Microthlaspi erraticum]|uniref:Thioglucosidase n=1 Tax=Microthlaspi erraticum TaxID=1685480 RepID=A0A6D2JY29_9BRAS|nr:unnamed protein product [Microthlaspi erraticum]